MVTEDDARDVVALMKDSVRDACTGADGNVDFSGKRRACRPQKP